jgi:hypothetical protein
VGSDPQAPLCRFVFACVCREVLYENGADGKPVVTGLRIARAGTAPCAAFETSRCLPTHWFEAPECIQSIAKQMTVS